MTRAGVNRVASVAPLILSAVAFAIVMANFIARVPPQPDEKASAHIWQLLMVGQLPITVTFLGTSDWRVDQPNSFSRPSLRHLSLLRSRCGSRGTSPAAAFHPKLPQA